MLSYEAPPEWPDFAAKTQSRRKPSTRL